MVYTCICLRAGNQTCKSALLLADLEDVFTGCVVFAVDSAYAFCLSSVVLVLIHDFGWDVMLHM